MASTGARGSPILPEPPTSVLAGSFTALNSIKSGGIHPMPGQTTGGNGSVTGQEVEIDVSFTDPFSLPAGHYVFVPQVELNNGDFSGCLHQSRSSRLAPHSHRA
jgi:hypothetical protein